MEPICSPFLRIINTYLRMNSSRSKPPERGQMPLPACRQHKVRRTEQTRAQCQHRTTIKKVAESISFRVQVSDLSVCR